jgi:hypothetical protein
MAQPWMFIIIMMMMMMMMQMCRSSSYLGSDSVALQLQAAEKFRENFVLIMM